MPTATDTNERESEVLLGTVDYYGKTYRARVFISGRDEGALEIIDLRKWPGWTVRRRFVPDDQAAFDDWVKPKPPDYGWFERVNIQDERESPERIQLYPQALYDLESMQRGITTAYGELETAVRIEWWRVPGVYIWYGHHWHRCGNLVADRFQRAEDVPEAHVLAATRRWTSG